MPEETQRAAVGALTDAVRRGNVKSMLALLERGADVNEKKNSGETPLIVAACQGKTDIIRLLLDKGANIDDEDSTRHTALLWAMWHRNEEAACLLIERGADINHRNNCGSTTIMFAARRKSIKAVRLLIDYGATLNDRNSDDENVMDIARKARFDDITQLIEEAPPVEQRLAEKRAQDAEIAAEKATKAAHASAAEKQANLRATLAPRPKLKIGPKP